MNLMLVVACVGLSATLTHISPPPVHRFLCVAPSLLEGLKQAVSSEPAGCMQSSSMFYAARLICVITHDVRPEVFQS
jgi:hypothetical protein